MVDNSVIQSLPLPTFAKVRYNSWQIDEMIPATDKATTSFFMKNKKNGIEVSGLSTTYQHLTEKMTAQGVMLMSMVQAKTEHPDLVKKMIGSVIDKATDRLSAQNFAQFNTGIFVYIPENVQFDEVLHLTLNHLATSGKDLVARIFVYIGSNAKVDILQEMHTIGTQKTKASVIIEVIADSGAQVTYANIDSFGEQTTAFINREAEVRNHATVDWQNAEFNDGNVIIRLASQLNGEGSTSHTNVIGLTTKKQTQGLVTTILNRGRHSLGHIFQRGVILNRSTLVFNGIGKIIKGAKGSDAQQESRVLMLSRRARGDANPLLLIDENDVTAGHAASVGRVDENQMYYLMSRGISEQVARKLVIRGFMGEVLAKMPTKEAQQQVVEEIERKLKHEDD
ncbi:MULTISPECIES: Fe-S cluster assembly protein SufD [Leuconostoc]|uniref:FeS cluster assembly protein SufB n=1 Tax=Leuconostoc suionicum TaxID=1511761 RepID=A0A2N9KF54_9LACO|nr:MULTISPECIES: Fe-S cluster assembly protein SufD [Leuconostoc]API72952.1 Fe-S cluster assembly protein SufD [Leuconostoc suionicum]MBE4726797.1 Fe-S cluster assembly protein SufD [Leuconostoc suionicum]MCT4402826.1 Fe-S cluster assembly protein SufD [Leuconostoc suionicum]MDI6498369.1 Fe-S cluster assembly protein SufD [Leuconostoc suionicum]MDI6500411.1 Fe-S cluster assembly protein SufD [Leuconostoc suionicum]